MSETPNENQTAETAAPGLQIMVQYVRDLSFENPGAPNFADMQPEINVNANVGARKLSDTDYEVGLKFRIEAKTGDNVQFIAELEYCGVFRLINIPENDTKPVLLIEAPRQLFPLRAVFWPMQPAMAATRPSCLTRLISWHSINKMKRPAPRMRRPKARRRKTANRSISAHTPIALLRHYYPAAIRRAAASLAKTRWAPALQG